MADIDPDYGDIKSPVVRRMLKNFKLSSDAESDNRARGLKALQFRQGGKYQWDDTLYNFRIGDNRPAESYNQIPQFLHQITNDMRMNMAQTKFIPGEDGDKEVAEVLEDLNRAIQSSSEGEVAYDAAVDSQVTIGWGYWRYITEYENPKTFDQIIKILWIPNPFKVYDDPNSLMQDFSDRKFLIEVEDIALATFNAEYGKNYDKSDLDQISSIGDNMAQWASSDNTIRIAEYWEVTTKRSKLYRTKDGKTTKTKPKGVEGTDYDYRDVEVPTVHWYKCNAKEILDEREWPGIYIPYVRVSGETLFIDGKVYYSGLVEQMMAPQKQYNYWSNAATEMVAMQPIQPYMVAVGQTEGLEQYWDNLNIKRYPYMPYKPVTVAGQVVGAPQRQQNSADIGSMMALVQQAQQNFYSTTGIYPASLGQVSNEKSGKAIMARQREGDTSTFHFPDNLARGLRFGGRIQADLIPKIYDGARAVRLLKEDKSIREVKINQEFEDDDGKVKKFDLTTGTYDVAVVTGPSFTTRRQEAAESMTQIIQAAPQLMEVAGDLMVGNMDWPGADKLAERLKKLLPPQLQEQTNTKDIPPQVQAQMQQMEQMLEQLQQVVQKQAEELQSKQADIQLKEADIAAKAQDMQIKGQSEAAKNELDRMKLELEGAKLELEQKKFAAEHELNSAKVRLDATKVRLDAKANVVNNEDVMTDPDYHENGEPPMMIMLNSITQVLNQGLQQVAQITAQSSQAIVESNAMVAQSNSQVAAAISTPKQVVRNPETGMISGVVSAAA